MTVETIGLNTWKWLGLLAVRIGFLVNLFDIFSCFFKKIKKCQRFRLQKRTNL